jgi:hypothetical protein
MSTSGAYDVVTVANAGMTFNLKFVRADHPTARFEADIEKAAGILSSQIQNHITMNLQIGYGEVGGFRLTNGEAAAGPDLNGGGVFDSYSTVRTDLINARALGAHRLPTGSSINGQSQVEVWTTQEKLFGQLSPTAPGLDGSAGFAKDVQTITGKDVLVGVALHELTHAMGRVPNGPEPDIFDFYRFTSPGARLFSGGIPSQAAYFSIDGGVKKIADYGINSDPSDFLNNNLTVNDSFDEFYNATTLQTLTSKDINQLRVLGFNVSSTPASAEPSFEAWNALASSGGVDGGSFGVDHASYGSVGARDVWGVSVPRNAAIDHFDHFALS